MLFRAFFTMLLIVGGLFAAGRGYAQISVGADFSSELVMPEILRDSTHRLTLDSVIYGAHWRKAFRQSRDPFMTFGADPSNWWLHFRVTNNTNRVKTVILRINRKNFDELELWHQRPDTILPLGVVGADVHDDPRFGLTDGYHFAVTLLPGSNELWAKASNRIGSMHMGLSLYSQNDFAMLSRKNVLLFGLFLGVMTVSFLFGALLFAQYRDPVYLLYLAYVLNILLRETYNNSADFGFAPVFQRNVTSMLIATTFGLFFRQFMRLWELNKWLDRVVKYYALLIALLGLVIWVLAKSGEGDILKYFFTIIDTTNLLFTAVALIAGLWYFRTSIRARIITAAYLPLAAGFVAILLRNMNVISNYPIITQAVMWGFIIEVLVFTVAFSIWSRTLEDERRVLQLKLEVEKRESQLAVQAAEQRVKDRIARDLHDDVAASMSGIRILSQVAQGQFASKAPDAAPILEQISRSAQSTLDSIGDLIWAVKPNADYLNDMADRMREYAAKVLDSQDIQYHLNIPRNLPILDLDIETRRNVFLIFKEAVNNAAKYSRCNEMDIGLRVDGNLLWLHVCDDGQGFSMANIKNGNGLGNMTKRANDIGGDLQIVSAPGAGTQVRLYLPIHPRVPENSNGT